MWGVMTSQNQSLSFPLFFFFLKLSLQTTLFCRCLNVLATCLSSGGGISLSVSQKPEGLVWPKAHSSCLVTVSTNQPLPSTCRAGVSAVIGLDVTCCILQTVRVTLRQKGHGSAVADCLAAAQFRLMVVPLTNPKDKVWEKLKLLSPAFKLTSAEIMGASRRFIPTVRRSLILVVSQNLRLPHLR